MIYFILNEQNNHVKIGFSNNPDKRLSTLQTACSHDLKLLLSFYGDREVEKYLHNKFKKYHVKNEWFDYNDQIKDLILYLTHFTFEYFVNHYCTNFKEYYVSHYCTNFKEYLENNSIIDFLNIYFDLEEMDFKTVYNIFLSWYMLQIAFKQNKIIDNYPQYNDFKSFEEECDGIWVSKRDFIQKIFFHRIDYKNIIKIAFNQPNFRTVTDIFYAKLTNNNNSPK